MEVKDFKELPEGIKQRIKAIHPDDYEIWVYKAIPALNNRSIIKVFNQDGGIVEVVRYLKKVEGYLGIES